MYGIRVFEFVDENDLSLFLSAPDYFTDIESYILLNKYINWYNNYILSTESNCLPKKKENYKFVRSFTPIKFLKEN